MKPYVFRYISRLTQSILGKLEYWRRVIDDIKFVTWHPYLDCKNEDEDDIQLPFLFQSMILTGQTH